MDAGEVELEAPEAASVSDSEGVRRGERLVVTVALLLAMAVAALEQTVVSTAMTRIIAALEGVDIYPWVFSAYLLASTIMTPLYGKLADLFGRRHVLLFGIGVFAFGSMLCGFATSMPALIASRVIQGLGAGALGPIVLTMISDLYSLRERGKIQGYFSAVWGLSSIVGPALGGFLADYVSWRWVFFVTLPFSLTSMWILARHVSERVEHKHTGAIDWLGALLLAGATASLLSGVLSGNRSTLGVLGFLAIAAVLIGLFIRRERSAENPILPLDFFLNRPFAAALAGNFIVGWLFFGIDTYIPLFVQGALGRPALAAGRALTPLFLAWAVSVALAAKLLVRFGFRATAFAGLFGILGGTLLLVLGARDRVHYQPYFTAGMILIGVGFGPTFLSFTLSVQNAVGWNRRGAATASLLFLRTMGGAIGVGLLGAALGFDLKRRLVQAGGAKIDLAPALQPEKHAQLSPAQLGVVQGALGGSLSQVFLIMLGLVLLTFLCVWQLPSGRPESSVAEPEVAMESPDAAEPEDDPAALAALH